MRKELISLSKCVSLVLRHDPKAAGLTLDKEGWVKCSDLIVGINKMPKKRKLALTGELLEEIVETNNKKRFEYSEDSQKIRARQGHSVEIDLGLEEVVPPDILYHGTGSKSLSSIFRCGISKMKRHHVHLSPDPETAVNVGSRHGRPVVLEVSAKDMYDKGFKFYLTDNGVWLVDRVPHDCFKVGVWTDTQEDLT